MNKIFKLNKKVVIISLIILVILITVSFGTHYILNKRSEINNIKYKELVDKSKTSFIDNANPSETLIYLNEAISILPKNPKAYFLKSQVLMYEDKNKEALSAINLAIELTGSPTSSDYYARGQILNNLNRKEDAIKDYQEAIKMDPNNLDIYKDEALVLNFLKKYDEALSVINVVLDKDRDDLDANIHKGYALFGLKRCVEAATYFYHASMQDPKNESTQELLSATLNSSDCNDNNVYSLTYNQITNSKISESENGGYYKSAYNGKVIEWQGKISAYYSQITGIKFCITDEDHPDVDIDSACDWFWASSDKIIGADDTKINPSWDGKWVDYTLNYYQVEFDKTEDFYNYTYWIKGVVKGIDCISRDQCVPDIDIISIIGIPGPFSKLIN